MEVKYLTIGVKGVDIDQLKTILIKLNVYEHIDLISRMTDVDISIEDSQETLLMSANFLKENGLQDETPFFNDFEVYPYGTTIDFNVRPKFKYLDILEPAVFTFGQFISSELRTETIVMFENMQMPIGLFRNGILSETFERYNEHFFAKKIWRPKIS